MGGGHDLDRRLYEGHLVHVDTSRERVPPTVPADAIRKAEVVLNLGTGAGLPAHRKALDHNCFQPFRSPIHSCAKTRRSGAVNAEVVFGSGRFWNQPSFSVICRTVGCSMWVPSGKNTDWQSIVIGAGYVRLVRACSSLARSIH